MICVSRVPTRFKSAVAMAATALLSIGAASADQDRFMIGESIHVGPEETLDRVTCVACSIRVDGEVNKAAVVVLGSLENHGTIEGDAFVVLGSLESEGPVNGDSVVVVGDMKLGNGIHGDAVAVLGDIEVADPGVKIDGDVVTILGRLTGVTADTVGGHIEHIGGDRVGRIVVSGAIAALLLLVFGILAVVLPLNGLAFLILGSKRVETIASTLSGNCPVCFLVGLATCFALGVVGMIVAMLLPVSLPIVLLFLIVSVVGFCGMTFGIGRNLFAGLKPLPATLLAGALVVAVQLIPVVGWLVMVVLWNVAIGAAVLSGFGTDTNWLTARAGERSMQGTQAS